MTRWFRFYAEVLNDPKVQKLDGDTFKDWVNLLCVASQNGGKLPGIDDLAFVMRRSSHACLTLVSRLLDAGLLDVRQGGLHGIHYAPHGWEKRQFKSDTSTERVKRFRAVSGNVSETPPDTDTDTEKKEDASLRSASASEACESALIEKQKKPPDKNRGSRLPENWHPGDDWLNFTSSEGLTNDDAKRELENFRDYWRSVAGASGVKLDWLATWRNRVRDVSARAKRYPQRSQAGGGRAEPSSTLGAYQRAAARFQKPADFPGRPDFAADHNGPVMDLPRLEN